MKFGQNNPQHSASQDVDFLRAVGAQLSTISPIPESTSNRVFSFESVSEQDVTVVETQEANLRGILASVQARFNNGSVPACEEAAVQGYMLLNARGALTSKRQSSFIGNDLRSQATDGKVYAIEAAGCPNYAGKRSGAVVAALEAFSNTEQRNAQLYTFAYNYVCSRQDEFGETIWPTLTLPQDQVGFGIIVNRLTVHHGWLNQIDGEAANMGKIDLVRAARDHRVLSRKKTRAIPVVTANNLDKFVADTLVDAHDDVVDGEVIRTAPIKTGTQFNLLGLSQTEANLKGGIANQTDQLDPAVYLDNIYIKLGADVLSFNVYQRHGSNFVAGQQGLNEKRRLNFDGGFLTLTKDMKQQDGSAVSEPVLQKIIADEYRVAFGAIMSGDLNTESGNASVYGNEIRLMRVMAKDASGKYVALATDDQDYLDIKALLTGGAIIGFDLQAWKLNANLREKGDFTDRSTFIQLYEVPLLSPVTAQKPIGTGAENDATDFETLVTVTRFRLYTDCVTAVMEASARIKDFCAVPIENVEAPEGLGASRFHLKPCYFELVGANAIDCTMISGNNTHETIKNLQALIVNKLRDLAFALYLNSEYQAAQMALGQTNKPTLVIATDTILARYILVDGELRTLTDRFDYKVVSTLDDRFDNKIFITFVVLDAERNQQPNILSWGNLIWGSEVVVSANMSSGDSIVRNTIVQPRYLYVNHMPVCAWIEVTNLSAVFDESFLRTKSI